MKWRRKGIHKKVIFFYEAGKPSAKNNNFF